MAIDDIEGIGLLTWYQYIGLIKQRSEGRIWLTHYYYAFRRTRYTFFSKTSSI